MSEHFDATRTVRSTRTRVMWAVTGVILALFTLSLAFHRDLAKPVSFLGAMLASLILPSLMLLMRKPKIARIHVKATAEGVQLGDRFVPREKLRSALLRHEGARTFVVLAGAGSDVEVNDDEDGERLCRALELDAKSSTVTFVTFRKVERASTKQMLVATLMAISAGVALGLVGRSIHTALVPFFGALGFLGTITAAMIANIHRRHTRLVVGDDGIFLKQGYEEPVFVSHEEIASVTAEDEHVVITSVRGETMSFRFLPDGVDGASEPHEGAVHHARSVARRIDQALATHRAFAGGSSNALGRGDMSVRAWIDHLRRIGEGANATFRDVALTREQLLAIVESTNAASLDRLAAIVALRDGFTSEEQPRIRVAMDRCAVPTMREWMYRVATAPDEELIAAIEAEDSAAAAAAASDDEEAGEEHAERDVATRRRR